MLLKDNSGNIFITGYTENGGNKDIQTIKLSSNYIVQWVDNFDAHGLEDVGKSIGIDISGNSYVIINTLKT